LNNIKGIIFDLGRVLIKVDLKKGFMNRISSLSGYSEKEIMESLFSDNYFLDYEKGKTSPWDFYQYVANKYNVKIGFGTFVAEWNNIFDANLDMEKLCLKLMNRYNIGILSDIDILHWQYISDNFNFLKKIKKPVLSFQTGYIKPHPQCYLKAAESIGLEISDCLFIDDRPINVVGAIKTGMKAIVFENILLLLKELSELGICTQKLCDKDK
jgi:putative hydrolase of the HAD superfamily